MNEQELILRIKTAFDGAGIGEANKQISTLQGSAMGASKAVGASMLVAGAAVAGVGLAAVDAASTFQAGMSGIQAVTGATADEMEKVRGKAMQIGADTAFSAQEAATGMEELLKAGVSLDGVLGGAADAAIALASAGGTDLATSSEIAANAMNMFHLEAAQLPGIADLIAGAANASAISVEDFGYSMGAAGAVAATAGFSFDDMAVAVTAMGNAGIKGSDAGTSLKTMMMNLIPTTNTQIDAFKALGIVYTTGGEQIGTTTGEMKKASEVSKDLSAATAGMDKASKAAYLTQQFGAAAFDETGKKLRSMSELGQMAVNSNHALAQTTAAVYAETQKHNLFIDETTGAMKPLSEIAGVLQDKMKNLSESERMVALEAMFGSDAIRAAAVMADQGKEGFDGLAESMGAISAADVAATRLDNFAGSMDAFKGSVETVMIQLGEKMLPTLREVTDAGGLMVNAFGAFINGDVEGAAAKMSEGFASLGMNVDPGKFTEMFTAIQDGVARIKDAFAGSGEGIGEKIVTAITGVVDIIVFLVEHPAVAKWGLIIAGIVAAIAPVAAILAPIVSTVGAIVGLFGGWAAIGSTVMGAITGLIAILGGPLTLVIAGVVAAIALWMAYGEDIIAWVSEWGGRIIQGFKDIFQIASPSQVFMDMGMALIQGLIDGIASLIESVVGILSTLGGRMVEKWGEIKENILAVVENIRVMISAKWDAIKEYLDAKLAMISAAIGVIWQGISDKIAEAMQWIQDKINEAWTWIFGKIDGVLVDIQGIIGKALDWIENATGVKMDGVRAIFDGAMVFIRGLISAALDFITGDWDAGFEKLKTLGNAGWAAIKQIFSEAWENLKKIIDWEGIKAKFETGKAVLMAAGKAVVDGIKQGIADAWEALTGWLKGKIDDLFALIKGPKGIDAHSPSKRAADEIGRPLGEGIMVGLQNSLDRERGAGIIAKWIAGSGEASIGFIPKMLTPILISAMTASMAGAMQKAQASGLDSAFFGGTSMAQGRERAYSQHYGPTQGPGSGAPVGAVTADAFRSGRGGHVAASKSNYWQVFVQKWGIPTEESARKVARQLGIPLPQWLEDIYNPKGSASYVDPMEPMKDAMAPAAEVARAFENVTASAGQAAEAIDKWAGAIAINFKALDEAIKPITGGASGIITPGPGGPIVIEPPPSSEVSVASVEIGAVNTGATTITLDGKVLARAIVDVFTEDTVVLDKLGKALGKRKATT